jgi:hypothetical protein
MTSKNYELSIIGLCLSGSVLIYQIFIFDYKRDDFTGIHALLGLLALVIFIRCLSHLTSKND